MIDSRTCKKINGGCYIYIYIYYISHVFQRLMFSSQSTVSCISSAKFLIYRYTKAERAKVLSRRVRTSQMADGCHRTYRLIFIIFQDIATKFTTSVVFLVNNMFLKFYQHRMIDALGKISRNKRFLYKD